MRASTHSHKSMYKRINCFCHTFYCRCCCCCFCVCRGRTAAVAGHTLSLSMALATAAASELQRSVGNQACRARSGWPQRHCCCWWSFQIEFKRRCKWVFVCVRITDIWYAYVRRRRCAFASVSAIIIEFVRMHICTHTCRSHCALVHWLFLRNASRTILVLQTQSFCQIWGGR